MSTKTIKVPTVLSRAAIVERAGTEEAPEFKLSISSDEPYLRHDWYDDEDYYEVLDHGPDGIKDDRLKAGLPILFNHDRDQHLARASGFVNTGKKCYVTGLKWSESDFAQTKKKDMESGALPDTSVGYKLMDEGECIGAKDGIPIYKFKWAPHEASLVTIPADISVGAGRSCEGLEMREMQVNLKNEIDARKNETKQEKSPTITMVDTLTPEEVTKREEAARLAAQTGERGRVNKISDWSKAFKIPAMKEKVTTYAEEAIRDGMSFEDFRQKVNDNWDESQKAGGSEVVDTKIGMGTKDLRDYRLCRAISQLGSRRNFDGLEKAASDAVAKRLGKDPDGFFIPDDVTERSMQEVQGGGNAWIQRQLDEMRQIQQRTLTAGNFVSAGALIGTELLAGSFIELLRNKTVIMSLGPTILSGLTSNVTIPKQVGASNAQWLAEGGSVTASDQSFAQLALVPHRLAAQTAYDKQLLIQASLSVEALVRNDIALQMAIKKDLAGFFGSGVAGEPLGIANTTGVQTVTFSTTATWAKAVEFETDLATANADQLGTPVFVANPTTRGKWKTLPKVAASTFPIYLWGNADGSNNVNGYMAFVTNQIGTSGATASLVFFFVPSELILADWAGIDVVVNPYSLDSTGQIRVTVTQWCDIAVRHPAAFIVSTDSGAQ